MFVEIPLVQRYPRLGLKFLPHDSRKMQRRLMLAKYLPRDLAPPPAAPVPARGGRARPP